MMKAIGITLLNAAMLSGCRTPVNGPDTSQADLYQVLGKYLDVNTRRLSTHKELTDEEIAIVAKYYMTVQPTGPMGTSPDIPWGIPLTKEMADQLVEQGVLPPLKEK